MRDARCEMRDVRCRDAHPLPVVLLVECVAVRELLHTADERRRGVEVPHQHLDVGERIDAQQPPLQPVRLALLGGADTRVAEEGLELVERRNLPVRDQKALDECHAVMQGCVQVVRYSEHREEQHRGLGDGHTLKLDASRVGLVEQRQLHRRARLAQQANCDALRPDVALVRNSVRVAARQSVEEPRRALSVAKVLLQHDSRLASVREGVLRHRRGRPDPCRPQLSQRRIPLRWVNSPTVRKRTLRRADAVAAWVTARRQPTKASPPPRQQR